jgi:hypothetical protein
MTTLEALGVLIFCAQDRMAGVKKSPVATDDAVRQALDVLTPIVADYVEERGKIGMEIKSQKRTVPFS